MKIGVMRYGLPLNNAALSTVGGGRITAAVLRDLQKFGDVDAVGKVNQDAEDWLDEMGVGRPAKPDMQSYDAVVILTGPSNPMYGGYRETYELLDGYEGKALYLQWDAALPFHFRPKPYKGDPIPHPTGADWYLLTQADEKYVRRVRSKTTAYHEQDMTVVPCLFERVELERDPLPVIDPVSNRMVYCGSDRPARITELRRWFGHPKSPPVDVYGKWSNKNRARIGGNVHWMGEIPEEEVAAKVNEHLGTMYLADPKYVKQDFIAQRYFENAIAGAPVAYSGTQLQPSVQRTLQENGLDTFIVRSGGELSLWYQRMLGMSLDERQALVQRHRDVIERIFRWKKGPTIEQALAEVLA